MHDSGSRLPLNRGGHAHIYNNYFENIDSAVNARTGSKLLIENNYFKDVGRAIGYWLDTENPSGLRDVHGNICDGVSDDAPTESTTTVTFESDCEYSLDPTENVPDLVKAGAGAGQPL